MRILLTNDDGVEAQGIKDLHERSFSGTTAKISVDSKSSTQAASSIFLAQLPPQCWRIEQPDDEQNQQQVFQHGIKWVDCDAAVLP